MREFALIMITCLFWADPASAAIPEQAKKHMARGSAALEMANDHEGYKKAIAEFEAAANAAPDWPDPRYNLGMVFAKIQNYGAAIGNFREYLRLSPQAQDAATVQNEIYKLEYRLEEQRKIIGLYGWWHGKYEKGGAMESYMNLYGNGIRSTLVIKIPNPWFALNVSDLDIANGKFAAHKVKVTASPCKFHVHSLGGAFSEQGVVDIEIAYAAGADCPKPGKESVIRCSLVKGNFIGILMGGWWHLRGKAEISYVMEGSPAHKAGMQKGDKLIAINGDKYRPMFRYQLANLINAFPQGETVTLTVKRKGQKEPLEFKFVRP